MIEHASFECVGMQSHSLQGEYLERGRYDGSARTWRLRKGSMETRFSRRIQVAGDSQYIWQAAARSTSLE